MCASNPVRCRHTTSSFAPGTLEDFHTFLHTLPQSQKYDSIFRRLRQLSPDSKSGSARSAGSSPARGTTSDLANFIESLEVCALLPREIRDLADVPDKISGGFRKAAVSQVADDDSPFKRLTHLIHL